MGANCGQRKSPETSRRRKLEIFFRERLLEKLGAVMGARLSLKVKGKMKGKKRFMCRAKNKNSWGSWKLMRPPQKCGTLLGTNQERKKVGRILKQKGGRGGQDSVGRSGQ